jgi:hypothetical protein
LKSVYLEISIEKEFIKTKIIIIKEDSSSGIEATEDVKDEKEIKKRGIFSIIISLSEDVEDNFIVQSIPKSEASVMHKLSMKNEEFVGIVKGGLALDEMYPGTIIYYNLLYCYIELSV